MSTIIDTDLTITGTLTLSGGLGVNQVTCNGDLTISGNSVLAGSLEVQGTTHMGTVTAASLTSPGGVGSITINRPLAVSGAVEATSLNLTASGASFAGDAVVYSGSTAQISARSNGYLETTGDLTVTSFLEVKGPITIEGDLSGSTMTIAGDLTVESPGASVEGSSSLDGDMEAGQLYVSGTMRCATRMEITSISGTYYINCSSDGTLVTSSTL